MNDQFYPDMVTHFSQVLWEPLRRAYAYSENRYGPPRLNLQKRFKEDQQVFLHMKRHPKYKKELKTMTLQDFTLAWGIAMREVKKDWKITHWEQL